MKSSSSKNRSFASDNNAGVCPEAWAAWEEANQGHATGYGDDRWTERAADLFRTLFETDKELGLTVHMDGARFANAVASLGVTPKEITWQSGVDVLCFGGTKNGIAVGDAVVFFNRELAQEFDYRCKQAGQLASKMRYLSAPWIGLLEDGAWLRHASHANAMAALLEQSLRPIEGVNILSPRQANSVFVQLPTSVVEGLHERGWWFYTFIGAGGCRLMCSWDTDPKDVRCFISDVNELA